MKKLKLFTILGILFVLVTGTLSHFIYDWTGNNYIAGLFTPVNESVWEHMKLVFFPMLLYTWIAAPKLKSEYPCITSALPFGILAGTLLIPVLFYAYTFLLGKDVFVLDLATFIVSVVTAFLISYRLTRSCKVKPYTALLYCLICILFICFMVFTYHAPKLPIFDDPTT